MLRLTHHTTTITPADLHPKTVFDEERRLAREFVMGHPCLGQMTPCPLSGLQRQEVLFSKWGQQYALCPRDWNLSLASMPPEDVVHEYFYTSELAEYRASDAYQRMADRLRLPLWQKQSEWLESVLLKYMGDSPVSMIDWGTKFDGWIQLLKQSPRISRVFIHDCLPPVKECISEEEQDVITLRDAFQRTINPQQLILNVKTRLRSGGLLVISCRSGSGFDILSLRENSDSIFPFDHICLPSPTGMAVFLEKHGFAVLELTTPGQLDMQILRDGTLPSDQLFQRYLKEAVSPDHDDDIQAFLQEMKLSSHVRVVARKR